MTHLEEESGHDSYHNEPTILDPDQPMDVDHFQDEVDAKDMLNSADLACDINQVTICFPLYPLTVFINRGLFCF